MQLRPFWCVCVCVCDREPSIQNSWLRNRDDSSRDLTPSQRLLVIPCQVIYIPITALAGCFWKKINFSFTPPPSHVYEYINTWDLGKQSLRVLTIWLYFSISVITWLRHQSDSELVVQVSLSMIVILIGITWILLLRRHFKEGWENGVRERGERARERQRRESEWRERERERA